MKIGWSDEGEKIDQVYVLSGEDELMRW
jgi:hypothetical protein